MILINLLPHREMARKRRRDLFNLSLGLAAGAGLLVAGGIYLWIQGQISTQQELNQVLTGEIQVLDRQIKEVAALETEIAALYARQQAVEDLQADRNLPVHLLSELAHKMPDGVHIASMKQEGQMVTLQGSAQSNERVSELLRVLTYDSPWFTRPELVEIVAGNVTLDAREQRRVANFTLRAHLVRPSELAKAAEQAAAKEAGAHASGTPAGSPPGAVPSTPPVAAPPAQGPVGR